MPESNRKYFELLKQKIVEKMKLSYPGINPSISQWKGQEIVDFQEELLSKASGQISEKWFYTHMKSAGSALPRIDVLNLLSRYAGYDNWNDFLFRNAGNSPSVRSASKPNRVFIWIPVLTLMILGVIALFFKIIHTKEYRFCFYDADTREPITNSTVEITLLRNNESPVNFLSNEAGCYTLKTSESHIRFVARSPYYFTDTIDRILDKFRPEEQVKLRPNNYALMISYFSGTNVDDWQKRKMQLNRIIDDTAVICEVFGSKEKGMELLTKREFIDKLTMPSATLRGLEVLDTKIKDDRIQLLRFRIREDLK